jgi:tetraacyldisaccharide 4'-kinase
MKYLLLPFSLLYGFVTDVRNYLYDKGFWKTTSFDIPIINVGNLTVGGTGKTPHVEYLIRLLKEKKSSNSNIVKVPNLDDVNKKKLERYAITTLSRGYGRKTKGFIIADSLATAQTIGDEPYQFYQKFANDITVSVGENRVESVRKILAQKSDTEVIILDDAFQHRPIQPSLNILLMDYSRPIYDDFTFPAGRLRERRHGAKRADIVIVTKNPDSFSLKKQEEIELRLQPYVKESTPFFYTKFLYGKPQNCRSEREVFDLKKVILLSGIANPKPFEEYAKKHFEVDNHLIFNDHHDFTEKDLVEISSKKMPILMTEKDMVKFIPFLNHHLLKDVPLYYLPIEIGFFDKKMKTNFDKLIFTQISLGENA